ncbi:transcriptional regulator [Pleomorphomonas diazotrophica]|uniref:Transcriptional regulator n=1 Tax=Pleomorphomonas diazotrophica TaxID=1166257 RepID=A0A1I4S3T2_9HYPH|nr:LacI family DNA-binding transcriptional regulator [Pleomorphomonas diazotrophica]PKR89975.1 transcriptional regulator [Pleomorphomonas diazotrophica]SFM59168.1 DNA-binding transcriptional regulator, LacI/PurR family [Pleomorphomonas diazotrophica]
MTELGKPRSSPRFVSARDVAKLAGVSRSAVSRAFTPGASVAPETREKIMVAATRLGYQVNDLARGLLAHRSRIVGLVATKPELGFRAHLTAALAAVLIRRGSVPVLINAGETAEDTDAAQRTLFGHRAEAVIVLSGSPPSSFIELAKSNGLPIVAIGREAPEIDIVQTDNAEAARRIAAAFASAGHKRLAFAGSESGTPSIVERERAFLAEAGRLGIAVTVARGPDTDYVGGLLAAERLFAAVEKPTAVFAVNDLVAFALTDHLKIRLGLRVPEDVAVVGFDDLPEAAWLGYRLTTFRQDPMKMAERAVALLEERATTPSTAPVRLRIAAQLMVRDTFSPPNDGAFGP